MYPYYVFWSAMPYKILLLGLEMSQADMYSTKDLDLVLIGGTQKSRFGLVRNVDRKKNEIYLCRCSSQKKSHVCPAAFVALVWLLAVAVCLCLPQLHISMGSSRFTSLCSCLLAFPSSPNVLDPCPASCKLQATEKLPLLAAQALLSSKGVQV